MRAADPSSQLAAVELVRSLSPEGTHVGTFYPRTDPGKPVVVVQRTGGIMTNRITDGATITIQTYAANQAQAESLAGDIRNGLLNGRWSGTRTTAGHMLRGWREYAGPARYTDPDRPTLVRFQLSGQLLVSTLTRRF